MTGFLTTWGISYSSTLNRIEGRNVRQGGNDFLAAVPLGAQAMWGGFLLSEVASAVSGPLSWIAKIFSLALHPFVAFPVAITSCAVKERFYESSAEAHAEEKTKYYERVNPREPASVTLRVDGVDRHFRLGNLVSEFLRQPQWEVKWIEWREGGETKYYELGEEIPEPLNGWREVDHPTAVQIYSSEKTLYYKTGRELESPEPGSRSFLINGVLRHYESAKYMPIRELGLSVVANRLSEEAIGYSFLPTRLRQTTEKVWIWINQNGSQLLQIITAVAGAVFAYFGHIGMAVGTLAPIVYEYLDHDLGILPQKVSLFMEEWLPLLSDVGMLIVGSGMIQMVAAVSLLMMIPSLQKFAHHKLAKGTRQVFTGTVPYFIPELRDAKIVCPELEETEAPFLQRKDLNRDGIWEILNGSAREYELNPSFLTHGIEDALPLEEDHHFGVLLELWDQINWEAAYQRILPRLIDDKRFILFLQKRFPQAQRFYFDEENQYLPNYRNERAAALRDQRREIDHWLTQMAQEKNISKGKLIAYYLREQLQFYVDKLSGVRAIEGSQRNLKEAAEQTAKIIPFLKMASPIDKEDALLKLAVEGGDYCALAMSRASREVLAGFTAPLIEQLDEKMGVHQRFEHILFRKLLAERKRIIDERFAGLGSVFKSRQLQDTGEDIHLYEALSYVLRRGFYPISEQELREYPLVLTLIKDSLYLPLMDENYRDFTRQLPELVRREANDAEHAFVSGNVQVHENRVVNYLRDWVENHEQLSAAEKGQLLNGILAKTAENFADHENHQKWTRLFLNVVGIYRKKVSPEG
jgi:hypothetical protein